ncbi:hypothetical protein DFR76_101209 [Nocardia pseudobrasiliensis]|uniref:Uncharacterized protein n=1 Tax=Nocardia pseudobrasiliensis TaxID=45979 RepID=A0A370IGW4_9NOCA|nr:hypothetical protein DFR76_101209 [Nocardia pseudobrasiliensis]
MPGSFECGRKGEDMEILQALSLLLNIATSLVGLAQLFGS